MRGNITRRSRRPRPGQVVAAEVDSRDRVLHLIRNMRHDHQWYARERDQIPELLEYLWGVQLSHLVADKYPTDARERLGLPP